MEVKMKRAQFPDIKPNFIRYRKFPEYCLSTTAKKNKSSNLSSKDIKVSKESKLESKIKK